MNDVVQAFELRSVLYWKAANVGSLFYWLNRFSIARKIKMENANYEFHEVANLFPLADGPELEALAESIRAKNGLEHPIVLHEGKIVDGRRRYLACQKAGIAPTFVEWDGEGLLLDFVLRTNLHRRHLTSSQRTVIGLKILPLLATEAKERQKLSKGRCQKGAQHCATPKGKATELAAKQIGCSPRLLEMAKQVQAKQPDLIPQIEAGEISVAEAHSGLNRQQKVDKRDNKDPLKAEFATPAWLFEILNNEFGFGLDAAATAGSTKCERFFSPEEDGLKQDWTEASGGKSVFCNPPWCADALWNWVAKAYQESLRGSVVVMVVPCSAWYIRHPWYRYLIMQFAEIRMVHGGVVYKGFGSQAGNSVKDSRIQTVVAVFRPGQNKSWNGPYIDKPGTSPPPMPSLPEIEAAEASLVIENSERSCKRRRASTDKDNCKSASRSVGFRVSNFSRKENAEPNSG